jgi:hypothetical protein
MTGMMMVEHETIPIQRIISVACRNFMAFDGLHTFNFDEGVNTIVGGNSSGKSSLVTVITQALSRKMSNRWDGKWYPNYRPEESLIEMKFLADNKEHYLRRVMLGDTTTDLHLYVGNGEERTFYRDGEVIDYFRKFRPITTIDGFENSRKDFYFWTSGKRTNVNPLFAKSKEHVAGINRFLPMAKSGVRQLRVVGNDVMAEFRNGELRHLSTLSGGDGKIIFIIAKIVNLIHRIGQQGLSKVILIDEIEIGLDKSKLYGLYSVIEEIANEFDCQFMITSRFVNGRLNPIRVNRAKIPRCYVDETGQNLNQMIRNFVNSRPGMGIIKTPPYTVKSLTKKNFKKGLFKWKP